jgi:GNAT superfamily N-acetyltransferase
MEPPILYDGSKHAHLIPSLVACHVSCITSEPYTIANFLPPLDNDLMTEWWTRRCNETRTNDVLSGNRYIILQLASNPTTGEEEVAGVVMLEAPFVQTGPFRGMVTKLLVGPQHRRKGIAKALMIKLEEIAKENGRLLLVSNLLLDCSTS